MAAEKCVVISTHILEEVEAICNRIIIIDFGRVLVDTTPGELCAEHNAPLDQVFRKLTKPKRPRTPTDGEAA